VAVPTSLSVVKEVLAERISANDNESDGRTRALPPTDMPATASEDTQRTSTDDATPRLVVAEPNTPGMLPTLDDTSSSPESGIDPGGNTYGEFVILPPAYYVCWCSPI
jgi:hypothetical protein